MPDIAPTHVSSTIYLTQLGFYDGLTFHRVIRGFMAQGGDPIGNGTGGPGYQYAGEFCRKPSTTAPACSAWRTPARTPTAASSSLHSLPTPHLDGRHSVFGRVTGGTDTLRALEQSGSQSGQTTEKLEIKKASISVE